MGKSGNGSVAFLDQLRESVVQLVITMDKDRPEMRAALIAAFAKITSQRPEKLDDKDEIEFLVYLLAGVGLSVCDEIILQR